MGNYISTDQNVNLIFATINDNFLILHKNLLNIKNILLRQEQTNITNINIIIKQDSNDFNGFTWDNYEIDNIKE
jgi:hypothetical protein|tara:strand:- start:341 stop:562 length:222 start_codon:yes stop_codon:yes gene_type:complete